MGIDVEYKTPLFFHVMGYAANASGDIIDMVSGNPDWGSPPAISEGLHEYADLGGMDFQYPPSEGLKELRQEIAEWKDVDESRVVVTVGGGEANYLGMARGLEKVSGNEVLMTDPVYPYYPGKARMLGAKERYVSAERDGSIDAEKVRRKASNETAVMILNTPNNPTGAVYRRETMRELVSVAEEYDALLVSDEVYEKFDFSGEFVSALEFDSPNVVVTNSFSKTFAVTGFRVGFGIFPEELVEDAKSRHMLTNVAGNRPSQYAVLKALKETDESYHEESRKILKDRVDRFTSALEDAGAEYTTPEGSFYVMARFDGFPGTLENVEKLIDEAGVAGMPGSGFGEVRDEWIRFALVTPRVEEAAERLAEYFG